MKTTQSKTLELKKTTIIELLNDTLLLKVNGGSKYEPHSIRPTTRITLV